MIKSLRAAKLCLVEAVGLQVGAEGAVGLLPNPQGTSLDPNFSYTLAMTAPGAGWRVLAITTLDVSPAVH